MVRPAIRRIIGTLSNGVDRVKETVFGRSVELLTEEMLALVDPIDVIAAFDEERARVFGAAQARPYANGTDLGEAKAMLDGGDDLDNCRFVFRSVFERQKAAGKQPAGALKYMRNPVAEALVDPFTIPEKYRREANGYGSRNPSAVDHERHVERYHAAIAEGREPLWLEGWGDPPAVDAIG